MSTTATLSERPPFSAGDEVIVGRNDAKVGAGSTGTVVKMTPEPGHPIIDVAGRGRVALTADRLSLVDEREGPVHGVVPHGIARELYLNSRDTAEELGISAAQLKQLSRLANAGTCRAAQCRYTTRDIQRLRAFQSLLKDQRLRAEWVGQLVNAESARRIVAVIRAIHGPDAPFLQCQDGGS
jgi:hypothetical protein